MAADTVFLSEYVSEDSNPWNGRERYGIFSTFTSAAKSLEWLSQDYNAGGGEPKYGWGETDTYGGSHYGKLVKRAWKWSEKNEDGVYEDDGEGYGLYIWEEYVDGDIQE
jgi:hypothetical protein